MKNCFPQHDGSLIRRPGLTSTANLKYGTNASDCIVPNRGLFWHKGVLRWIAGASDGKVYQVEEGADPGATVRLIGIAANRLTFAYSGNVYGTQLLGGGVNFAYITNTGIYGYFGNPGKANYTFDRGIMYCRTGYSAGVGGNKALIYVDVENGGYITAGDAAVPVIFAGTMPYNDILLIVKEDGRIYRYSGYTASDARLKPVAKNTGELIPYTLTDCSPYGLMFSTAKKEYLIYRLTEIQDEIDLMDITEETFDIPLMEDIDNAETRDNIYDFGVNVATSGTASASTYASGHPASNLNDNSLTTYWQTDDTDRTTGITATASSEDGTCTASKAIDDNETTLWKTPASGSSTEEWWRIDLGAGNSQAIKLMYFAGSSGSGFNWTLQGSDDGTDWTGLTTSPIGGTVNLYRVSNTNSYRYYQLAGSTTDRGGGVYYAQILEIAMYSFDYDEDVWIEIDFGPTNTKTIKKIQLYKGTPEMFPLNSVSFKASNNGSDWTVMTPDLAQSELESGSNYYYNYYFHGQDNAYRYYRVYCKRKFGVNVYSTSLFELKMMEIQTQTEITTGKKTTSAYHPGKSERWRAYTNRDGDYKIHIYNFKHKCWWEFETESFGGSFGVKNDDLYLALKSYTPEGGELQPSGIYKYGGDNTADPYSPFSVLYRTGWIELPGSGSLEINLRRVYIDGKGWDTCKVYYEIDGADGSLSFDIAGLTNPRIYPPGGLRAKRLKVEVAGFVDTGDGDKEIFLREVDLDFEEIRS
ncbi:MAG: discoidin domain-containing protein [Chloroflexi bacterium]|nr:discoidin domain-containing protein [Chloroflexota bacterium]